MTNQRKLEYVRLGVYPIAPGAAVPIREIADPHLVNALLKALAEDAGDLAAELVTEVRRRGIQQLAYTMAAERMAKQ